MPVCKATYNEHHTIFITMKKALPLLVFILLSILYQPLFSQVKKQKLRVSDNKRFLVYEDGTPFFYLGDTAWEFFHRLTLQEAAGYLDNRKAKGFTVIQAVALAELDGLNTPNQMGHTPLKNNDPTQPNEAYFKDVDAFINLAADKGLYIGLLPTWGDKLYKDNWGAGPEVFTVENAAAYGRFLGKRYKDQWNIIWILGGDRNPRNDNDVAVWRAMAAGITEGVGDADKALMSFHPQPRDDGGSSTWFHNDQWLDFNMHQTGHCINQPIYEKIEHDYALTPTKPVMDAEPMYEDHPICFDAKKFGHSNADNIRKLAYWQLFAGAHGHTYGCHSVWQMFAPGRQPVNVPLKSWKESLDLPGATQMGYVKKLMLSQSVLDRIPDQSLIVQDNPKDSAYCSATRAADGHYAFVYTPTGKIVQVKTTNLRGTGLLVRWFNPRNGEFSTPKKIKREPVLSFKPPTSGNPQSDWVLVLSSAK